MNNDKGLRAIGEGIAIAGLAIAAEWLTVAGFNTVLIWCLIILIYLH